MNNYSMNDYKARYNDIVSLCDAAEELLATVESPAVVNPQKQLDMIEPLINEIADSSDVLAEEFLLVAESNKARGAGKYSKKRIESALRRVFIALNEYDALAKQSAKKVGSAALELTKPIIAKIQEQLDKVVLIFMEFVQISLQSVMNKAEIDAIRVRNQNIALMMHKSAMSSQYS